MKTKSSTSSHIPIVEGGIEKREYFYNQILQQLPLAFYTCDATGIITFFNQAAADLWGGKPELGVDRWCGSWKLYHLNGQSHSMDSSPMTVILKEGRTVDGQKILIEGLDGSRRNIMLYPQLIFDDDGQIMGAFNILEDLTDRKREKLEAVNSELNEKNEELQKINLDLDNFIYIASHDLKAPVANIEGLLVALSEMLRVENSSKQDISSVLQMMKRSIDRFLNTINDLTTITKIQKDIEVEIPEKVNIPELIEDIKLLNGDLIANTDALIFVDCENCREITFSRKNLKRILYNLITNSIKYRSPVRIPEIQISVEKKDKYIILKVKDNGLGLDENKQKKLFSMFKRFHDHVEGSGIGLYLVKRIITNAGGKVEVESKSDLGSTFKVYIKQPISG